MAVRTTVQMPRGWDRENEFTIFVQRIVPAALHLRNVKHHCEAVVARAKPVAKAAVHAISQYTDARVSGYKVTEKEKVAILPAREVSHAIEFSCQIRIRIRRPVRDKDRIQPVVARAIGLDDSAYGCFC